MIARDTCAHVLNCCHQGRVEALKQMIALVENYLEEAETDLELLDCIVEFALGRGGKSMEEICHGLGEPYMQMAKEQDAIGWRRFMAGMICKGMRKIQHDHHHRQGTRMSTDRWAQGLIIKLLEVTHGQWIYRNIQIHDAVTGTQVTWHKEELLSDIEEQLELGEEGLLEDDHWLLEVKLGDLESTTGEQEEYWLLAMKAAREAYNLVEDQDHTRLHT